MFAYHIWPWILEGEPSVRQSPWKTLLWRMDSPRNRDDWHWIHLWATQNQTMNTHPCIQMAWHCRISSVFAKYNKCRCTIWKNLQFLSSCERRFRTGIQAYKVAPCDCGQSGRSVGNRRRHTNGTPTAHQTRAPRQIGGGWIKLSVIATT